MWNTNVADGGYPYGGGGFFSGATGGAFGGALVGSLVGDAIFPGGRRGHDGGGHGGERMVQIVNGQPYGWNGNIGQWEIMKEVSDTRYDLASMNFQAQISALNQQLGNDRSFAALQGAIAECCCGTQLRQLESDYKTALMGAGISREIAECCCENLLNTTRLGYETQLRDQTLHGAVMKELQEVKCLIKDTEKDSIIRAQEGELNNFRRGASDRITIDAINALAGRIGGGLNQVGVNQVNTAPATSQWPPWVPTPVYSL